MSTLVSLQPCYVEISKMPKTNPNNKRKSSQCLSWVCSKVNFDSVSKIEKPKSQRPIRIQTNVTSSQWELKVKTSKLLTCNQTHETELRLVLETDRIANENSKWKRGNCLTCNQTRVTKSRLVFGKRPDSQWELKVKTSKLLSCNQTLVTKSRLVFENRSD